MHHKVNLTHLRPSVGGMPTTKDIHSSYIFREWGNDNWEGP